MFKKKINSLTLELDIQAISPLLIQKGNDNNKKDDEEEDTNNDIKFLCTGKNNQGDIFIPGSTLKGVFRSQAEKIMRILSQKEKEELCCNIFEEEAVALPSCSSRIQKLKEENKKTDIIPYNHSCPVCRIFGNQHIRGRFHFEDAFLTPECKKELPSELPRRAGAPINRFVGDNNNLFFYEYVQDVNFRTKLSMENFELWQLGLMAFIFRDLYEEEINIGFGSSRGMGKVKGRIEEIEIKYFDLDYEESLKPGELILTGLAEEDTSVSYDFAETNKLPIKIDYNMVSNGEGVLSNILPRIKIEREEEDYCQSRIWKFLKQCSTAFKVEEISHG